MSMFLPEGQGQAPGGTGAVVAPASPETTAEDVALMQRVLQAGAQSPNRIPEQFMAYILDWIQIQRLIIPIGQVFGYSQSLPSGLIFPFAGATAPSGYLLCDGSAISRASYPDLFATIGTTYGAGDGSTTFNLPDIQGRALVGKGTNADVSALANSDGLSVANRSPKHNTTVSRTADVAVGLNGTGDILAGNLSGGSFSVSTVGGTNSEHRMPAVTQQPTFSGGPGGSRPTDTPAFLVVNHIIKT